MPPSPRFPTTPTSSTVRGSVFDPRRPRSIFNDARSSRKLLAIALPQFSPPRSLGGCDGACVMVRLVCENDNKVAQWVEAGSGRRDRECGVLIPSSQRRGGDPRRHDLCGGG